MKTKLIDLMNQRATLMGEMENALQSQDKTAFAGMRVKMTDLDAEISDVRDFLQLQENNATPRDAVDHLEQMEQRAEALRQSKGISFTAREVKAALFGNSTTIDSGELALPTSVGTNIRDRTGAPNSILDMVTVVDLTGTGGVKEPYVVSEMTASVADVETSSGTARTDSDPTFGYAEIRPDSVSVTAYVDKNISLLTPVAYYQKVQALALKALRKKAASLIYLGDGLSSPRMFGLGGGVDTDGNAMYSTVACTASTVDQDTVSKLFYAVGNDDEVGGGRLFLNKADLVALGSIRGTNEKKRLFEIVPDGVNMNTGIIKDGGMAVPYCLSSSLAALSKTTAGASGTAAKNTMIYGDPKAYELGLFGGYTIRLDESVKSIERMIAILGDVMLGGNLVQDKSIVVAQVLAATGT